MPMQPWLRKCSDWAAKAGLELKNTSTKSLQSVQPTEGEGWADLPAEVIEQVLDKLDSKDSWNSRLISSNWNLVVRDYQCELVIPVDPKTLWSQSASFRQRQAHYPRTRFTFKLARPFSFSKLADMLSATVRKDKLSECDIEATLASLDDQSPDQVLQTCKDVKDLAAACKALLAKDVLVRLRLWAVLGYELTTMVTKELAPFLHSVDYHRALQLSSELTKTSDFFLKPAACFCQAAFNNLSSNNSPIQSLCLSDRSLHQLEPSKGVSLENSIGAVASLQHLTKLHLTILARTDFEPLSALTGLQDLALQSDSRSASASEVLHSNSQTLHTVKLVSRGWNAATLTTLQDLPKLQTFTLKVLSLCAEDAQMLSRLLRPSSVQIMLRKCAKMKTEAFRILSSRQATITHLEFWELEPACFCALQTMPSLQSLTIARPPASFTGEGLAHQPALATLRLVSCFTLSNDGLHGLVSSAPSLKMLLIQQELQHACPAEFREQETLTKHGLVSILSAPQLVFVDLTGVKVTRGGEKLLESSIVAQQKAGKMQPAVALLLPKFSKRLGDHVFTPDSLHYPSFAPHSEGRTNMLICGSLNKAPNLKEIISSMQALAVS